jgi:hypothetical protein
MKNSQSEIAPWQTEQIGKEVRRIKGEMIWESILVNLQIFLF